MFMRLVQAKVKPEELYRLRASYEERIVPALQKTPGCLYAGLMQGTQERDEVISMTLWESQEHAEAYIKSGLFQQLLDEARPMFAESSEWHVQLSKDLTLEYVPVATEPTIKAFPIAAMSGETKSAGEKPSQVYLRIVSMKLKEGMQEEFQQLYVHEIIPSLQTTKDCRHAYLLMPGAHSQEALSVTIWDSKEAADSYEQSGTFAALVEKVKHTFTDMYQWKMNLDKHHRQAASSDDITVGRYSVVTGKEFH